MYNRGVRVLCSVMSGTPMINPKAFETPTEFNVVYYNFSYKIFNVKIICM